MRASAAGKAGRWREALPESDHEFASSRLRYRVFHFVFESAQDNHGVCCHGQLL